MGTDLKIIKFLREKAGLTQLQLAEKLGIDVSTVCKWETAGTMPRADKIPAIASALSCDINDLYPNEAER